MLDEVVLKVVESWLPSPCMAAIAATAISAAIRPYSMAVAPALLLRNFLMNFTVCLLVVDPPANWLKTRAPRIYTSDYSQTVNAQYAHRWRQAGPI